MFVKYTPEDGDAQNWEFDPRRVRQSEGEKIEKLYGDSWPQFVNAVQAGDLRARRVLLWHLMLRDHPRLRFEDTPDFMVSELVVSWSASDLRDYRERIVKSDLDASAREQVLAGLDVEIADAEARESGEGKAPASADGSSSGG